MKKWKTAKKFNNFEAADKYRTALKSDKGYTEEQIKVKKYGGKVKEIPLRFEVKVLVNG